MVVTAPVFVAYTLYHLPQFTPYPNKRLRRSENDHDRWEGEWDINAGNNRRMAREGVLSCPPVLCGRSTIRGAWCPISPRLASAVPPLIIVIIRKMPPWATRGTSISPKGDREMEKSEPTAKKKLGHVGSSPFGPVSCIPGITQPEEGSKKTSKYYYHYFACHTTMCTAWWGISVSIELPMKKSHQKQGRKYYYE